MASITVTTEPDSQPPVNRLTLHASDGCIFTSLTVTRVQDGSENLIRRQPTVGTSDALAYDYEPHYDVPATYRISGVEQQNSLSSSWVGTANASASTLSKDGTVIATNLSTDPNFVSSGHDTWQTDRTLNSDGTYTFTLSSGKTNGTFYLTPNIGAFTFTPNTQYVIGVWYKPTSIGIQPLSNATHVDIVKDTTHYVFSATSDSSGYISSAIWIGSGQTSITPIKVLAVSQSDYDAMQALGVDWFAGDTYQIGATNTFDTTSSAVTLTPQQGWLIHPGNPAKSMPLPLGRVTGFSNVGRGMNATRHDMLGATLPVYTITGPRLGLQFTLELRTRTLDEESMLWALLDDQIPVLINWLNSDAQRLNMKPMYLQIGDVQADRFAQMLYPTQSTNTPGERREWKLPCTQVQSPAISQQAVGWTYVDLFAEQHTYLAVQATYATYADLQAHNKKDGS